MFKILTLAVIILSFTVKTAGGFSLPKLKVIYDKPRPALARIHGSTSGLPVLTVDFVNKPLWSVLRDVSNKTGYMFTSNGIDLGKKVNLKGRYNLAKLLAVLFAKDKTFLNLKTKKITIRRGND
ncbi:MAG: hypothetical protein M0016_02460 [Deltaproteobacteria bacterium]|jgi:hypothetical protein|nr:hypothetical protein [Deltaproteobacteria bacterium]MDA8304010.1 hypothetical protein [Deltaproteobacteria bacterium]